jgi:hypothetical protein
MPQDTVEKHNKVTAHKGPTPHRVTITNTITGEVLEDCVSEGGVLIVVRGLQLDKRGTLLGTHGIFNWGNPMAWYYAFDQLREAINTDRWKDQMMAAFQDAPQTTQKFYAHIHEETKREDAGEHHPAVQLEAVTLEAYNRGDRMQRIRGRHGIADVPFTVARGKGFSADLYDEGDKWVCPNIESIAPGSGRFDEFIDALTRILEKPLVFASVINPRLKAHLERRGIQCL